MFLSEYPTHFSLNIFIIGNIYIHIHNTQQYTKARIRTKAWSLLSSAPNWNMVKL